MGAAAEAGREIDPEHFGAIVVYARDEIPRELVDRIAARHPGVDPMSIVPIGLGAARQTLERFVEVGVSKFVVRPAVEPASWSDELEEIADRLLPLQA